MLEYYLACLESWLGKTCARVLVEQRHSSRRACFLLAISGASYAGHHDAINLGVHDATTVVCRPKYHKVNFKKNEIKIGS